MVPVWYRSGRGESNEITPQRWWYIRISTKRTEHFSFCFPPVLTTNYVDFCTHACYYKWFCIQWKQSMSNKGNRSCRVRLVIDEFVFWFFRLDGESGPIKVARLTVDRRFSISNHVKIVWFSWKSLCRRETWFLSSLFSSLLRFWSIQVWLECHEIRFVIFRVVKYLRSVRTDTFFVFACEQNKATSLFICFVFFCFFQSCVINKMALAK